ncbi:helix-turn-helix transcriptional regulator [Streptosporangium lutulentum]
MNRTDRFHALIEELRAIAPRCRSARELATGLEVSVRTVERDLRALQQSGVPVRADPGGRGYALGESVTPLPIAFTPDEAVAVAAALSGAQDTPFAFQARSALNKLVAAMSPSEGASGTVPGGDGAGEPLTRGHTTVEPEPYPRVSRVIEQALLHRRVLRLRYEDRKGRTTVREVERRPSWAAAAAAGISWACLSSDRTRVPSGSTGSAGPRRPGRSRPSIRRSGSPRWAPPRSSAAEAVRSGPVRGARPVTEGGQHLAQKIGQGPRGVLGGVRERILVSLARGSSARWASSAVRSSGRRPVGRPGDDPPSRGRGRG